MSEYPVSGDSSYYGSGNPNASYYEYTATIEDSSVKVSDDDWLTVMLAGNVVSNGIVLDRAFVRTENGVSYVYKDDNGVTEKTDSESGRQCKQWIQCSRNRRNHQRRQNCFSLWR